MKEKPKFYAFYKDFNTGKIVQFDVLNSLFYSFLTEKGTIKKRQFSIFEKGSIKPITTKEQLYQYIKGEFMHDYWSNCTYEFIAVDWPYRDEGLIEKERPVKLDVYDQLEPNLPVITDLVWNYLEPKIKKSQK